ncbi:hypothetical protein DL766_000225 [Monosporascus sp. MC13-8B]|uniref:AMP-activated protein kinase glycogen-binding domain-containing protein n=1 Tax=Monosporascus cannonballus TaxID=155416 RepID=A0ABY0GUA0_9PEZI|nr:hypothetical protein DL762_009355 [Monosporascus cannonballus]RYO83777.1 hypothetical protein DL763_007740 [Monosporascus cannonballus]RYP39783.1 hypothetical protein DL766_000225 [Monosporascus sp. MC13-8B]
MASQVSVKLTYQKDDTSPPVYVAGSFSDPPWQPLEMACSKDEHGQNLFFKEINASEGAEIQYKFRVGPETWVLSESAETVDDGQGNVNNILRVPSNVSEEALAKALDPGVAQLKASSSHDGARTPEMANTAAEVADSAAPLDGEEPEAEISDDQAGETGFRRLSETPVGEVGETAEEAALSAAPLDDDKPALIGGGEDSHKDPSQQGCPMFSHECVAAPDEDGPCGEAQAAPPDDDKQHELPDTKQHDYAQDPDIDLDDPTIEKFPSDSASIMAAIRRLSTSVDQDRALPQGIAPSVVTDSSRPTSADGLSDDQSLAVSRPGQPPYGEQQSRTERRKKSSLTASRDSVSSLNSIAEADDERPGDDGDSAIDAADNDATRIVEHPGRAVKSVPKGEVLASSDDDDEGIAMCTVAKKRTPEGGLNGSDLVSPEPIDHPRLVLSHIVEPVQSSTPVPQEDPVDLAETVNPSALAVNHARAVSPHIVVTSEEDNRGDSAGLVDQDDLQKGNTDHPIRHTAMNPLHEVSNNEGLLHAFFRVLLVDWIGNFLSRLWPTKARA